MRRLFFILFVMATVLTSPLLAVSSENFPAIRQTAPQAPPPSLSEAQYKLYYGYVPPPPIRHSWPGGYRVLVHEVVNTLMDHLTGRY